MRRAILAGLLAIAAVPATAQAAPPQQLSPPDGAIFPLDSTIEFTAQSARLATPLLLIAVRPDLNPDGFLARAFTIDSVYMREADATETLYSIAFRPSVMGFSRRPPYTPGTYYWQAVVSSPGGGSPVRSFTLQPSVTTPTVPGFSCQRAQNQLRRQRSALTRYRRSQRRRPTAATRRRIARARSQVRRYQQQVARYC